MKSDGVEDVFKWLEKKCKEAKENVKKAEKNYENTKKTCWFEDELCLIDSAKTEVEIAEARLDTLVEVKRGVEKYMKKLRYDGQ